MPKYFLTAICLLLWLPSQALAHFGMVIPSSSMITDPGQAVLNLSLSFSHPMAMEGMKLEKPRSFKMYHDNNAAEDITDSLKAAKVMGQDAWTARRALKSPGLYQFVMEPAPYWEEAEDCFIIHYVKTYVAAFGEEDGWDAPLGLKTEIVPLSRPFGNYAGNLFQGRVLLDGKPVPGAEVEVEFFNQNKQYAAPNEYMLTQVIRADDNGIFSYAVPFAGWWGFAALNTSEEKMLHQGAPKDVEIGAVLWLEFIAPRKLK